MADMYLLVLVTAAALHRVRPLLPSTLPRIVVLVPAHNEELIIGDLLKNLTCLDYPDYHIYVIADNCTDRTEALCRNWKVPYLTVWKRTDFEKRGKGHALAWGFQRILSGKDSFRAAVIIDADSKVSPLFLKEMAAGLERGCDVQQGDYRIDLANSVWRRRIAYISAALYHHVRSLGRCHLGLSSGLFGNGVCLSRRIVEEVGWQAYSLVEDIEYQALLALRGISVHYRPSAVLWALAPESLDGSATQRRRWEVGRYRLISDYVPKLIMNALRKGNIVSLGVALDILMPSYTMQWAAMLVFCLPGLIFNNEVFWYCWSLGIFALVVYLVGGLLLVDMTTELWLSLLGAPFFAGWVVSLHLMQLFRKKEREWLRTPR